MPVKLGDKRGKYKVKDPLKKFMSKVAISESCWDWLGGLGGLGDSLYGKFRFNGKQTTAHRAAYEMFVGPVPEGFEVHHKCKHELCVNPEHLEALSVNDHRALSKKEFCLRGHPMSGTNLYIRPDSGSRACKECRKVAVLKYKGGSICNT